ncbi:OFA family MFS transporter [bacterium]|nr:OFA family MFS transporter [bacterium]MBU4539572.1 OFA family MFS transporter [Bacteroidota bacterium]MCG2676765.1 OFA family MFS transporter [bacterium]MCG2677169.1 OFA family MFS transporter [bacterium]
MVLTERKKKEHPAFIVVAGTTLMLMMGVAYVWGVYVAPLMETFGWNKFQASLPFSVFLLSYTVGMILGGRLQDIYGPKKICTIGALLFGGGYLLSSFTASLTYLCLVYGIIGGIGTGFAYVTPMATVIKWFPHKKGLMGGIVVFGFGAGAFLLAPLARMIISNHSWQLAFRSLGMVFMVLGLIAAQFLRLPPEDWMKGVAKVRIRPSLREATPREVLRAPLFWMLWCFWTLNLIVGLGLMGHIVVFATESGVAIMAAAFILSVVAIFNGAGRIALGALSDKVGRMRVLAGASFLVALVSFLLPFTAGRVELLYILGGVFGLSFGGWLISYPTVAAEVFGTKHLGANYGLLFASYGVGGFIGPLFYSRIYDTMGSYQIAFSISGAMCLVAGVLALVIRYIAKKEGESSKNAPLNT